MSHCPICQGRLLSRHVGPVHLYDDDIPTSFNATNDGENDGENESNSMQAEHNDMNVSRTNNENSPMADISPNNSLISENDDANEIAENLSMSVNSLVAEHVSANETNDTFMNIDEIEHSNNNSENVVIETPSNQQVNLHLNHADNFIVIFIFELFLF